MSEASPLIITLQLDEVSFAYFGAVRKKYFPPAINFLTAHLTLFHHLPAGEPSIREDVNNWSKQYSPMQLNVTEVKSIGKGVAYKIECPGLSDLHKKMQQKWHPWLIPQDRQKLWPHVTVQNKVSVDKANETLQHLQASFQPFTAYGLGFHLWIYEGRPWHFVQALPFSRE